MTAPHPFRHPTIAAPGLVYVCDDGEGRHYLKVQASDGTLQAWPIDATRALTLAAECLRVAREIDRAGRKAKAGQ